MVFPRDWQAFLPDYCGCVAKIDQAAETVLQTLSETELEEDTIVVFISDHGCHFRTRGPAYKQTPHESSIHIPFVVQGPGFNRSAVVSKLMSQIDLAPALLDAVGVPGPGHHAGQECDDPAGQEG